MDKYLKMPKSDRPPSPKPTDDWKPSKCSSEASEEAKLIESMENLKS